MRTTEIIREIQRLPISKRIYVVEKTMNLIRTYEEKNAMQKAADVLLNDYKTDRELTALTIIDYLDFYEAK